MLEIKNLTVSADEIPVIANINLSIGQHDTQAIIGPNFSGKSGLAYAIMGHPDLAITQGSITFNKKKINLQSTEARSKAGIFLSTQHKLQIQQIDHLNLIKQCFKIRKDSKTDAEIEKEFLSISNQLLSKNLYNDETLRLDLLLMALLKPSLVILDQIDELVFRTNISSLAEFIIEHTQSSSKLIISNSSSFLGYFDLSCVSVMIDGEIKHSGSLETFRGIIEDGNTQLP